MNPHLRFIMKALVFLIILLTLGSPAWAAEPLANAPLPDVIAYTEDGKSVRLRELVQTNYTVLVAGCLTCPIFRESYSGVEAVARDYAPRGVRFFYFYKSLAHPEYKGYVVPQNINERLLHIQVAKKELGTRIPWLADTMADDLKNTLNAGANSEYLIAPGGKVIYSRQWSDAASLRAALAKVKGPVENPTPVSALDLPAQSRPGRPSQQPTTTRVVRPSGLVTLKLKPASSNDTYYVKLRAEAEPELLRTGKGQLYLGFFPDPVHGVHWNNLVAPLHFQLTLPAGVKATPAEATAAKVQADSDTDPREFWVTFDAGQPPKSAQLTMQYFGCTDKWCKPFTQEYTILFESNDPADGLGFGPRSDRGMAGQRSPEATQGPAPEGQRQTEPPSQERDMQRQSPERLLQQFDRDGDGKLSRDEAPERMQQRWDRIDTDHDGFVTPEELKARDTRQAGDGQSPRRRASAIASRPARSLPPSPAPAPM